LLRPFYAVDQSRVHSWLDYDEAIRLYRHRQARLRLPAFTDARECFTPENCTISHQFQPSQSSPSARPRSATSRKSATTSSPCLLQGALACRNSNASPRNSRKPRCDSKKTVPRSGPHRARRRIRTVRPANRLAAHRKVTPQELAIYAPLACSVLRSPRVCRPARHLQENRRRSKRFRFLWSPTSPCSSGTNPPSSGWPRTTIPSPHEAT